MSLLSQRSLHNAPIFRLLLKVAVNGTHQCDFLNFCGNPGSQQDKEHVRELLQQYSQYLGLTQTRIVVATV